MSLQGIKQNPYATREDLRRMSAAINELVGRANSGSIERISLTSTGATVTDDGLASIYYVDATDANVVFNMQPLVDVQDRLLTVNRIDGSTNIVTVTPASTSQLINGAATKVILSQFVSHDFHARNLTNWNIL